MVEASSSDKVFLWGFALAGCLGVNMKIFVSWSGEASNKYAAALKRWIPCVLQSADVFMSTHDIEKGERWLNSIFKNLENINFGIVVVTPENINAPWILFESGALSKDLDKSRLVPILCNVGDSDLSKNPLSSFQYVKNDKEGITDLIVAINANAEISLADEIIRKSVEIWWEEFSDEVSAISFSKPKKAGKVEDASIEGINSRVEKIESSIDELLYVVRQIRNSDERGEVVDAKRSRIRHLQSKRNKLISQLESASDPDEIVKLRAEIDAVVGLIAAIGF